MDGNDRRRPASSASVTTAGVDHVKLSYHYLDTGDIDAYGSLLDEDAQVSRPDAPPSHGRAEVLRLQAELAPLCSGHHIYRIVAEGDTVAVTGRYARPPGADSGQRAREVDFADFFTLTDEGLLLGYRRFYFAVPA